MIVVALLNIDVFVDLALILKYWNKFLNSPSEVVTNATSFYTAHLTTV